MMTLYLNRQNNLNPIPGKQTGIFFYINGGIMKLSRKESIKKMGLIMGLILLLTMNCFPWIWINGVGVTVNGSGIKDRAGANEYTFKGGTYFLEAYANVIAYLKVVENEATEKLDTTEVQLYLDNALENINLARETFSQLKDEMLAASYNIKVLNILKNMDYNAFRVSISADKETFNQVSFYLKRADIPGLIGKMVFDMDAIMRTLKQLKKKTSMGIIAALPLSWELNRQFSKSMMFGQYAAQVFIKIQQNMQN